MEAIDRPQHVEVAQMSLVQKGAGGLDRRQEELIVGAHHDDSVALDRARDVGRLLQSQAQRLLSQDVFARFGGGDDGVAMKVMRQRDVHRIEVGLSQHGAIVSEDGGAADFGRALLGTRAIDVSDSDDLAAALEKKEESIRRFREKNLGRTVSALVEGERKGWLEGLSAEGLRVYFPPGIRCYYGGEIVEVTVTALREDGVEGVVRD